MNSDSGLEITNGTAESPSCSPYEGLADGGSDSATPLDRVMGAVFPGSLGIDEGIAHLTMKASISNDPNCSSVKECGMPILYIFIVVWVTASIASLWWLRRVFSRNESTMTRFCERCGVFRADLLPREPLHV